MFRHYQQAYFMECRRELIKEEKEKFSSEKDWNGPWAQAGCQSCHTVQSEGASVRRASAGESI